jgi:hypothetical protein
MYRLQDHPTVYNAIKNDFWRVNTTPDWISTWKTRSIKGSCGGGNVKYSTKYTFSATEPDLSSIVTWHIQKPDSTWESITYGASREYLPENSGYYTVAMRQENAGLAEPRELTKVIYMQSATCKNIFKTVIGLFGVR